MITLAFAAFVILAMALSLVDWRRGWLLALVVGVLQDPARKLTPGTPVVMTFSIVAVYAVILFSSHQTLLRNMREMARRYGQMYTAALLLLLFLFISAINGLATFGLENWKVPALSFIVYLMPIPAVAFGYAYLDREERLLILFRVYAAITSVAMIGTLLEYYHVQSPALGLVALPEGYIRYLPGLQIRILSGFYRAPDIMGWHAAMLAIVGITMALRRATLKSALPWIGVSAWGFLSCMLSGRRKAVYMVAVFALAFVWRYIRRMNIAQIVSFIFIGFALGLVIRNIAQNEESSMYAAGTSITSGEVFERLEGGFSGTIEQAGFLGAGLGSATQGTYHVVQGHGAQQLGWQEGGLGKLAVELGVPGVIVAGILGMLLLRLAFIITRFPDEPDSSQLVRVALFGIVVANIVNFLVSAQAYSDPVLTLMSAFFVGALLATPALEGRRVAAAETAAPIPQLATT